ncbi:MAG: DUF4175 family protein, partial [Pirellulales bacterium]
NVSTSSPVSPGPSVSADTLVVWLVERLQETRRRISHARWFVGACCVGLIAVLVIATLAMIDYFAVLPWGVRAFAFCSLAAALLIGLHSFYRRRIASLTLSKAAVSAERRVTSLGQRLRTSLDYRQTDSAPAEAAPGLLSAMHRQTDQIARQVDWDAMVDARPALIAFAAAVVALTAWCVAMVVVPEYRTATARVLLLPAEYTRVEYTPHEQTARFGDSVQIEVTIAGRPLHAARIRSRPAGSSNEAWTMIELGRPAEKNNAEQHDPSGDGVPTSLLGTFPATFANLEHDLEVEVLAGPRPLSPGRITVLQPLSIEKVATHTLPPEYTRRPVETGDSLDLRVLEGSNVELRIELNRAAAEATLAPDVASFAEQGDAKRAGAEPAPSLAISGTSLLGTLKDLRQDVSFVVRAKAADGMSLEPTPVRIRVRLDQKPEIKFLEPTEETVVIPTAEVPIVAEASDDLGLHKVGIQYRLDDGDLQTLWEGSGDGSTDSLRAAALLMLEDLHVTFRNAISYYAFAEDNYFGAPRRTTTELRFIDVRPFKVEYQVVDSQGGSCNGSSASLEELIKTQRSNLVAAFAERESAAPAPESAEKLRRGEAELRGQTQEFAAGIKAKVGPVPILDDAVFAMGQAVERLSQRSIDEAVEYEQQALADLLEARENLRQILKNSKSQQASNCRKFDREFRQKLRLPEKKDPAKEQLAQARKKLDELSERERKWGQQAKQCCNSSGSSQSQSQRTEAAQQTDEAAQKSGQPQPDQVPSAQELAESQEQLRTELGALKQQIAELKEAGDAAPQETERADESMQRGKEELKAKRGNEANEAAEDAAQSLEELSDHLAALGSQDFGQRLDAAERQAQQIADRQESLAKQLAAAPAKPDGQLGREEKSLATRVRMLGELVDELRRDSSAETAATRRRLDAAASGTPPARIAEAMQHAALDLEAGRSAQAARRADDARDQMNELARALVAARGGFAQPQLAELLKLEEQLAQLIEQVQRAEGSAGGKGELKRKWDAVAEKLTRLAESDRRLAAALDAARLRPNRGEALPQGHYAWIELGDFHGVREVAKAMQAKIQEVILAGALNDSDQPVPPEYKPLVEKYYKTLSDDLR